MYSFCTERLNLTQIYIPVTSRITPWSTVHLGCWLLPREFYGQRRSVTVFIKLSKVSVLSQMNPLHILRPYLFKNQFHLKMPATPKFVKQYLSFKLPENISQRFSVLVNACYKPPLSRTYLFYDPNPFLILRMVFTWIYVVQEELIWFD